MHREISHFLLKHPFIKQILIQVSFICIIGLLFYKCWASKQIIYDQDFPFNLQRLMDVSDNLSHLQWPRFTNIGLLPYGLATPTMYPWLPAIILVLFKNMMTGIHLWIFIYIIGTYAGLNAIFFSCEGSNVMNHLGHNLIGSYLFTFVYVVSGFTMSSFFGNDIGEYYADMFFPLIIFGWLKWKYNGKCNVMFIGLFIILMSHFVSFFVSIFLLVVLMIIAIFRNNLNKHQLKNLLKNAMIFSLISAPIWLPVICMLFFRDVSLSQIWTGNVNGIHSRQEDSVSVLNIIGIGIFPAVVSGASLGDFCGFALGILFFKRLPTKLKIYFSVALVTLLTHSKLLSKVYHQYPSTMFLSRADIITHILSDFLIVYIVLRILPNKLNLRTPLVISMVLVGAIGLNIYSDQMCLLTASIHKYPLERILNKYKESSKHIAFTNSLDSDCTISSKQFNKLCYIKTQDHYDYFPKTYSHTYRDADMIMTHHKLIQPIPLQDGKIMFTTNKYESTINIPIATYKGQSSIIKLDGKRVHWNLAESGMVQIHNVPKGKHIVQLINLIMWYHWLAIIMLIAGIVWVLTSMYAYKRKQANDVY